MCFKYVYLLDMFITIFICFAGNFVSKDINGTRERVKHALQHEDDPVPHKRRRRTENGGVCFYYIIFRPHK